MKTWPCTALVTGLCLVSGTVYGGVASDPVAELRLLANMPEPVTRAIVRVNTTNDLARNLAGAERLEYLPRLRAYIVHDIEPQAVWERVGHYERFAA